MLFKEVKVVGVPQGDILCKERDAGSKSSVHEICHDDLEAGNYVLINVTQHPTVSVFQIHLNGFGNYQRRQWMLKIVKTVTL